ncbi:hypothetical protein ACHAWU_000276 [Discostella pseudostelligera]|uniref:Glutaredoxin-like protein n=1 Tax=Discostella pseudostelligera TaxID=259834 RepID=A0ABD3MGY1_9STRA
MTVVVSASCRGSYRVLPLLSQQRKPTSSLLGFVPHRHRRQVHLPSRQLFKQLAATSCLDDASDERSNNQRSSSISSVSGPIYEVKGVPTVKLFTKQGCTLCDKVKGALESVREVQPHSLIQVDITDDDKQEWFSKYKYDIPVLHINDIYWTKHRLSTEEAIAGISEARTGDFSARRGEPDAGRLEHKH